MQRDTFEILDLPSLEALGGETGSFPIRTCILTEEILGPVRNGGIASTYYHLARSLAAEGHEVHVLFLKGRKVQDATPEHWVAHYAEFGVALHYLDLPAEPTTGAAVAWQARYLAAYRWLRDQPRFDVVHTTEWRGGAVYALMAKRLGLAFADTLFVVKTSSPYIWNRHYQMQPFEKREMLAVAHAEQKCVELADLVIGGSAHLLSFMDHAGYRLPRDRVFVQPNIVDFSRVPVTDARPRRQPGDVVRTGELVFFGRLEARKGIEIFCTALDVLQDRGRMPEKLTFLGKWGAALDTRGKVPVEVFLEERAARWTCEVEIVTDKNQPEALSHMCSRDMIAVMPSLIENSTMAVYEALEMRIPFVATRVGGTAELIHAGDRDACLVPPEALALADRLQQVLAEGQAIARPSFSNADNLHAWSGFHNRVGRLVAEGCGPQALLPGAEAQRPHPARDAGLAVLLRPGSAGRALDALLAALVTDPPDRVVLTSIDATLRTRATEAADRLQGAGLDAVAVDGVGLTAGAALSAALDALGTEVLVAADGAGAVPRPGYLAAARQGLGQRPGAIFTTLWRDAEGRLGLPVGGDVASFAARGQPYGPELFAFAAGTWARLGPLEPYDVGHGLLHALVTDLAMTGPDDLLVHPEPLLDWPSARTDIAAMAGNPVYPYLATKPMLDAVALGPRKALLDMLAAENGPGLAPFQLRDGGRDSDASLWVMPVDWNREDIAAVRAHRLVVALDEETDQIWLCARGNGPRSLHIADQAQPLRLVERRTTPEGEDLTVSVCDIPPDMVPPQTLPMLWSLDLDGGTRRERFFRVNVLGKGVYQLVCRQPVLSRPALMRLLDDRSARDALPVATPAPAPAVPAPAAPSFAPEQLRDGARPADATLWVMPMDWRPDDLRPVRAHRLAVAIARDEDIVLLCAAGAGERRLVVDGVPRPLETVERRVGPRGLEVTLSQFRVPPGWETGMSYPIRWQLCGPDGDLRERFFRITKLQDRVYTLVCRQPILSQRAIGRLVEHKVRHGSASVSLPHRALRAGTRRVRGLAKWMRRG